MSDSGPTTIKPHDSWDGVKATLFYTGRYSFPPGYLFRSETRWTFDMSLCIDGHVDMLIDGKPHSFDRNIFSLVQPDFVYSGLCTSRKPVTLVTVGAMLSTPGINNPLAMINAPMLLYLPDGQARLMEKMFEKMIEAYRRGGVGGTLGSRAAFLGILAHALDLAASLPKDRVLLAPRSVPVGDERVQWACNLVDAQLDRPLTLFDLAKAAHLTPPYFSRLFHRATGVAPMEYLRQRRIDRAKELLARPENKIDSVARQVGFSDPAHFSRVFRRVVGMPPQAYARAQIHPTSR